MKWLWGLFWQWVGVREAPAFVAPRGLYVLKVDFPLSDPELRRRLEESLDKLKADYPGLDFFVLEPGITLSRFDAI